MTRKTSHPDTAADLRKAAEAEAGLDDVETLEMLSPEAVRHVLHDLRVHQIELETQNEELRRVRTELEASQARYFDLYDLAPIGYFSLAADGTILEANLTAASLLRMERNALVERPLHRFIFPADQDVYYLHRKQLLETGSPCVCELRMVRPDGSHFWARIAATLAEGPDGERRCRAVVSDIDERRVAEDALRESEERYRDLVENASDLICTHDLNGILLSVNAPAARASGFRPEEVVGRDLRQLLPPDRRADVESYLEVIRRDGEATGTMKVVTPAGAVRYWEYRNTLRTEGVERPVARGVARDVTEQVLAKRALQRSEEKYRAILDNMEESYYEVDLEGNLTFFNDSLCRLLGYSRDELMGMNDRQYTDRENAKKLFEAFNAVYRTGERSKGLDWEIIRKDRGKRIIEASVSLVRDSADRPVGFRGLIRDITERKRAEEALRVSEERFRNIADYAEEWIWELDAEGRYTYSSQAIEKVLGYTPEEMLQRRFYESFHPDDREALQAETLAAFAARQPIRGLVNRNVHRNGQIVWLVTNGLPLLDDRGGLLGYRGADIDVTDRKRAEEALEASRVQLLQAQKMEAVGRLAGGVAHDFNNILQGLLSLATVLRLRARAPELAKVVASIEELIKRGAGLTRQLLLFSRRQTAEKKLLNVSELAGSALTLLRHLIPENVRLTYETTAERIWVNGDAGQLQQVLVNLAVNAKDAMPAGGSLTVRTRRGVGEALIEVIDTGNGIDDETREHLFEPFFTTKEKGKGTGLGLSVVHGIVEQHGGRVEVESALGEGSVFRVALPAVPAPEAARITSGSQPEVPRGSGERVLLVEDEDGVRKGLTEMLGVLGYEGCAVGSAEEAETLPENPAPDILLTDLMLPGVDGPELVRRLTRRWPHMRVVMMSGYTDDEEIRRGIDEGDVNFLQKPFDMTALAQALRKALETGAPSATQ